MRAPNFTEKQKYFTIQFNSFLSFHETYKKYFCSEKLNSFLLSNNLKICPLIYGQEKINISKQLNNILPKYNKIIIIIIIIMIKKKIYNDNYIQ